MGLFGFVFSFAQDNCLIKLRVNSEYRLLTVPSYLITEAGVKNDFLCHFRKDGEIEFIPMPALRLTSNSPNSEEKFKDLKDWVSKLQMNLDIASSF